MLSLNRVYKQILQFLVSKLNIWANYEYFQTGMSENGTIHITMMKHWVSHILFIRKRGLIVYLAALKEGTIQAANMYYVIYWYLQPPELVGTR